MPNKFIRWCLRKIKEDVTIDGVKVKAGDIVGCINMDAGIYKAYHHTFSVNPYFCKLCGEKRAANELVLCDREIGAGENIVCEECASRHGIQIEDIRLKP